MYICKQCCTADTVRQNWTDTDIPGHVRDICPSTCPVIPLSNGHVRQFLNIVRDNIHMSGRPAVRAKPQNFFFQICLY